MIDMPTEKIDYLHDAKIALIQVSFDDTGIRRLRMELTCHSECGLEEWNGRRLLIEFVDTLVVHYDSFGHMLNPETFDSWSFDASEHLASSIATMVAAGIRSPRYTASLNFHSGSRIELACEQIAITTV